jgi:hypothetical protein
MKAFHGTLRVMAMIPLVIPLMVLWLGRVLKAQHEMTPW